METTELNQSNQATEEITPQVETPSEESTPTYYTPEELGDIHPTAIDLEKVQPEVRSIVEKTIKEYKNLQGDYTKKAQELAEVKRIQDAIPEKHFDDEAKDNVFKDYLKNPLKITNDINSEIAKLESILPDDGIDEYRQARRSIAYWQGIKDEFQLKKSEVSEKQRRIELEEAKLNVELGDEAQSIKEYAKSIGFSEREFSTNVALRDRVKRIYKIENAATLAAKKETKVNPHKAAAPSGNAESRGGSDIDDEMNLSVAGRIAASEKRSGYR